MGTHAAAGDHSTVPPWAGWRALVDTLVIFVGAVFLAAVVAQLVVALLAPGSEVLPALLIAISPIATLAVAAVWLSTRYGPAARRVAGRSPWRWTDAAIGAGLGLACFVGERVLLVGIAALLTRLDIDVPSVQGSFRAIAENRATAPILVLTAVLLAPVGEELLFRGVLYQGLRARMGFWAAALASAAVFTLAHLGDGSGPLADLIIIAGILPLGVVFAAVMERRGTLLACAVTHAVYNACGVALLILAPALTAE
jgi:membrane protease YdiL (CAAX protease family)